MSSFLQADIFFFISSIGFVSILIVFLIACFYVIKILSMWLDITRKIKNTVDDVADGIVSIKDNVADKVNMFSESPIGQIIMGIIEKRFNQDKTDQTPSSKPKPNKSKSKKPKTKKEPKKDLGKKVSAEALAQKLKNSDII